MTTHKAHGNEAPVVITGCHRQIVDSGRPHAYEELPTCGNVYTPMTAPGRCR